MMTIQCKQQDRDVPELICGYSLPCRWHTAIINTTVTPPTITIPATAESAINPRIRQLLKDIAVTLKKTKKGKMVM